MEIRVFCMAGYRGEETPQRLLLGDRQIEVRNVLDRWLAPDHRYFKIKGDDNAVYIVRNDHNSRRWELIFYTVPDTPPRTL